MRYPRPVGLVGMETSAGTEVIVVVTSEGATYRMTSTGPNQGKWVEMDPVPRSQRAREKP